jgi:putative endonuclease
MKPEYQFFVYIMASKSRVLYTGITNDLRIRVLQHKLGEIEGFTKRYKVHRLVYFESYKYVSNAIGREKEIKSWRRDKRIKLVESFNPTWEDLAISVEALNGTAGPPLRMKHDPAKRQCFGGGRDEKSS